MRYYSGILYPKTTGYWWFFEDGENEETPVDAAEESNIGAEDSDNAKSSSESKRDDWVVQCSASTFSLHNMVISFCCFLRMSED